jgi:hypothetical protein
MSNETTNAILNNVTLFWAKLDPKKPVEPFGELQWEIQVRFDKKRIKEMEQYGKVKETDEKGIFSMNLKKKALKKDGTPALHIKLVNKKGEELDPKTLGNGSTGNVKLMLKPYQIKGPNGKITKEGVQVSLQAVQVTEFIEYVPKNKGDDFDYDSDEDDTPAKANKPAPKGRKAVEEDDDIPF